VRKRTFDAGVAIYGVWHVARTYSKHTRKGENERSIEVPSVCEKANVRCRCCELWMARRTDNSKHTRKGENEQEEENNERSTEVLWKRKTTNVRRRCCGL
jgi:hypothetical protein